MSRRYLTNAPTTRSLRPDPDRTLWIEEGDSDWEEAYGRWLKGANPTASPEWKKGVFMGFLEGPVSPRPRPDAA